MKKKKMQQQIQKEILKRNLEKIRRYKSGELKKIDINPIDRIKIELGQKFNLDQLKQWGKKNHLTK